MNDTLTRHRHIKQNLAEVREHRLYIYSFSVPLQCKGHFFFFPLPLVLDSCGPILLVGVKLVPPSTPGSAAIVVDLTCEPFDMRQLCPALSDFARRCSVTSTIYVLERSTVFLTQSVNRTSSVLRFIGH